VVTDPATRVFVSKLSRQLGPSVRVRSVEERGDQRA
jgi:hypothetical protein